MSESDEDDRLADALRDVASRAPGYARLSASLTREGAMSAQSGSPLTKMLGDGAFGQVARRLPQLSRLDGALTSIGSIRYALDEVRSERAEAHLEAAGLTREQIERDHELLTSMSRRLSDNTRKLLHHGAHHAGRLTGKGLRALRRWKTQWDDD